MTKVNITQAAKLAGISRTHLYRAYINSGKISISTTELGKSAIDLSELLRVFNTLQGEDGFVTNIEQLKQNTLQSVATSEEAILKERIKGLEFLLRAREEELESYRYREKNLYFILENKVSQKRTRWWHFPKR